MTIVAEDVAVIQVMQEPTVAGERGVVSSIDHLMNIREPER